MRKTVKRIGRPARGASTVMVHAVLALLAVSGAYLTWTRDKTQVQSDQVRALDVSKRDIQSVTYKDETRTVTVERKLDSAGEAYAWTTVSTKSKTLATQPGGAPFVGGAPAPGVHGGPPPPAPGMHGGPPPPAPGMHGGPPPPAPAVKAPPLTAKPTEKPAEKPRPAPVVNPDKGGDKAAADKEGEKSPPTLAKPAAAPPAVPAAAPATVAASAAKSAAAAAPPPAVAAPPPAVAAPPIHEIKETVTTKSFRGSEQADKLLESFAPLMALRSLGVIDDAKAKELGLSDSKKTLTVQIKSEQVVFTIGNTSYGSGDVYVRDGKGQVFLLSSRFQSDFEYAESRLMERRLHRFERPDISRVEISVGSKKKVLVQQKRQDPVNYFWAEEQTPDKRDDTLRNWMDKVLRIAISDYVAKGEEPQAPAMSQGASGPSHGDVLTIRFFDGKKQTGLATFSRYPKGSITEYFATTETTIGLVRLLSATAESAVQDAEKW